MGEELIVGLNAQHVGVAGRERFLFHSLEMERQVPLLES